MHITREAFVAEIGLIFPDYAPNPEVAAQLGQVDLTSVTAPTSMGKDTLMNVTGLPVAISDTIRAPRANHGEVEQHGREYYFVGGELDAVLEDVRLGNYVQIGMGPSTNSFYGTRAAAYPFQGPCLKDIMPNQWSSMSELPFASLARTYITTPTFEEWERRAYQRGITAEEWEARRAEGKKSLNAGLSDSEVIFILNDELSVAAATLTRVAKSREYDRAQERKARNCAAALLKHLESQTD